MLDKLRKIEEKYIENQALMETQEVYSAPERYSALAKEQKELQPVVETYRRLVKYNEAAEEAKELLGDPEMRDMAREELESARLEAERAEEELKILLLPRDANDDDN